MWRHRARQGAQALRPRRRLAPRFDLRHGDRRRRSRRLGLPRICADLDGRHQAAKARYARKASAGNFPSIATSPARLGATAHIPYTGGDKRPSTGWHSEFADFNNDGLLDLFIAKGNVAQMPDFRRLRPEQSAAATRATGKFAEAGARAGIAMNRQSRGALIADFNLDGNLDLLHNEPRRNRRACSAISAPTMAAGGGLLPSGNWIAIKLVEPNPNRDAVGAHVAVKTGHALADADRARSAAATPRGIAGWIHVGLGTAERAEIRVQWPDGERSYPYRAFANEFVVIDRTKPQAQYWYPGSLRRAGLARRLARLRAGRPRAQHRLRLLPSLRRYGLKSAPSGQAKKPSAGWRICVSVWAAGAAIVFSRDDRSGARGRPRAPPVVELPTIDILATTPLSGGGVDVQKYPGTRSRLSIPSAIERQRSPNVVKSLAQQTPSIDVQDVTGNGFQPDVYFRGFDASPRVGDAAGARRSTRTACASTKRSATSSTGI